MPKIMLICTIKLFQKRAFDVVRSNPNSYQVLLDKNCCWQFVFKIIQKFCLENGQLCETALCRPDCIDSTLFCAGYGALSAPLFAIFKVIWNIFVE